MRRQTLKKQLITILCIFCMCILTMFCFSCDGSNTTDSNKEQEPCVHNWQNNSTIPPSCESKGSTSFVCAICDDSYTIEIPISEHKYSENLHCDSTYHFYECKCGDKKDEETHISSGPATAQKDEICAVCGYVINEAVGIVFKSHHHAPRH